MHDSAESGFPSSDDSSEGVECADGLRLFETFPRPGGNYLFGDIESVEPILDGVRPHGDFGERGVYTDRETYTCDNFGIAALRITLSNVEAPWADAPSTVVVAVTAESLDSLTSRPRIQKGTHKLQWSVSAGEKPRFPGRGVRIGLPIYGQAHGDNLAAAFAKVLEVHDDGTVTLHVGSFCVSFDAEKYATEDDVLKALRANPDYTTLDLSNDYTWQTTSICDTY